MAPLKSTSEHPIAAWNEPPTLRHAAATLRDDRDSGGRRRQLPARNVLGEPLEICSIKPMTGFYRDGCCDIGRKDIGSHGLRRDDFRVSRFFQIARE
jgi:hypothetical protein